MFYSPRNKNELVKLLGDITDNTFIIAGGTDLIIHLKNSKITDYNILDITKIKELHEISEDNNNFYIGSTVTMTEICDNNIIKNNYRALYEAAYNLGSEQIRNRATLGGNIANASQSADCSLVLFTYGAKVKVLNSKNEEKIFPIDEFIIGREKTVLNKDEAVIEIIIPKQNRRSYFKKVGARKAVTISKISCALDFVEKDGKMENVKIFLGAVGIKPVEAKMLEDYLNEIEIKNIDLKILQDIAFNEIEVAIPTRSSRFYKRIAIEGLVEDLIKDIL